MRFFKSTGCCQTETTTDQIKHIEYETVIEDNKQNAQESKYENEQRRYLHRELELLIEFRDEL
jgi:hypothetical protein